MPLGLGSPMGARGTNGQRTIRGLLQLEHSSFWDSEPHVGDTLLPPEPHSSQEHHEGPCSPLPPAPVWLMAPMKHPYMCPPQMLPSHRLPNPHLSAGVMTTLPQEARGLGNTTAGMGAQYVSGIHRKWTASMPEFGGMVCLGVSVYLGVCALGDLECVGVLVCVSGDICVYLGICMYTVI